MQVCQSPEYTNRLCSVLPYPRGLELCDGRAVTGDQGLGIGSGVRQTCEKPPWRTLCSVAVTQLRPWIQNPLILVGETGAMLRLPQGQGSWDLRVTQGNQQQWPTGHEQEKPSRSPDGSPGHSQFSDHHAWSPQAWGRPDAKLGVSSQQARAGKVQDRHGCNVAQARNRGEHA